MKDSTYEHCFICGGSFSYYATSKDFWHKTNSNKKYNLIKCDSCGLEKIYPTPLYREQLSFYPSTYYSYNLSSKQTVLNYIINFIDSFVSFFEIKDWKKWLYKKGKSRNFLEIGCGDGFLLKKMNLLGWNADGFEIGLNQKKGNIYYADSICNIDFSKSYDLILLKHVFEHLDDPIAYLQKIKDILKDDGECIIIGPIINKVSSKLFGVYAAERDIPRHLFNYNQQNLSNLLSRSFLILDVLKLRQISSLHSFVILINGKFGIDIQKSPIKFIIYPFMIIFELCMTILGSTNQVGFRIKKFPKV